jgi:hypothetical protein
MSRGAIEPVEGVDLMTLSRRDLIKLAVLSLAATAAGCSDSATGYPASTDASSDPRDVPEGGDAAVCSSGAHDTLITFNHVPPHSVTIADVFNSADHIYSLSLAGSPTHTHDITLTAAHIATLLSGATVTVPSTTTSFHQHEVTVVCV